MMTLAAIVLLGVLSHVLGASLQFRPIDDAAAVCNDGSKAGYYMRMSSTNSSKWIVLMQGGWYCFDEDSCNKRHQSTPDLMSSIEWSDEFEGHGILSDDETENPSWWDANSVFVGYCSSDHWTGNATANASAENPASKWNFLGSVIIEATIKEILPLGLQKASLLVLTGVSAGGFGAFSNLDHIADLMSEAAPSTRVVGLIDSGWLMNSTQFKPSNCAIYETCALYIAFGKGVKLWNSQLSHSCLHRLTNSSWLCLLGKYVYPTKTPALIHEYQYDLADLTTCNVRLPFGEAFTYVEGIGAQYREELGVVTSLFSPACAYHTLILSQSWLNVKVNDITISEAFDNFLNGEEERHSDKCHIPDCNPTCLKSVEA